MDRQKKKPMTDEERQRLRDRVIEEGKDPLRRRRFPTPPGTRKPPFDKPQRPLKPKPGSGMGGEWDGGPPPDRNPRIPKPPGGKPDIFERFPGDRGRMPMPKPRPKPPGRDIPKEWIPVDKWGEAGVEGGKKKRMKKPQGVMPKKKPGGGFEY